LWKRGQYDRTSVIEVYVTNNLGPLARDRFVRDRGCETRRRLATFGSNSFKAFNTRLNTRDTYSYYTGVRAIYETPRRSHATGERGAGEKWHECVSLPWRMHTYTRASVSVYDTRKYVHITQIYCRRNWGVTHL